MRKLKISELDLIQRGKYLSKSFRWISDREFSFDECEFLYDRKGQLVGVDYRTDLRRRLENENKKLSLIVYG